MVSAKGEEISKVKGLNMGADDYIAKPFGVMELIARIRANLRKSGKSPDSLVKYKDISIDPEKHSITVSSKQIQTTLKEYNLLRLFCENHDKAQEREKIYGEIWDSGFMGETRTLDIHVKELRKKLAEKGSEAVIETIRGVGYILK
jgi:two-component system alkaline phosphatase synthesis response regulator PhoP